jgi:hypothetical protein
MTIHDHDDVMENIQILSATSYNYQQFSPLQWLRATQIFAGIVGMSEK